MKKIRKNTKGFTLVELIVVIAIILILSSVLIPTLFKYIKKAREATAIACASQFQTAYSSSVAEFIANGVYETDSDVKDKKYAYEAITNSKSKPAPTSGRSKVVYDAMNAKAVSHEFEAIALLNLKTYQIELIRYKDFGLNKVFEWSLDHEWQELKSYPSDENWTKIFSDKTGTSLNIWWNGRE